MASSAPSTTPPPSRKAYTIGLTGGIATGKSTIAKFLEKFGAVRFDADVLGWDAYDPVISPETFHQVIDALGADLVGLDGKIDRKKLGAKVFGDKAKMDLLCSFVWPRIMVLLKQKTKEALEKAPIGPHPLIVVLEAAVLIEAQWDRHVDEVWVVITQPPIARDRLMQRNRLSQEEAEKRLRAQLSNEEKARHAKIVIPNDVSLETMEETLAHLERAVRVEWDTLLRRLDA